MAIATDNGFDKASFMVLLMHGLLVVVPNAPTFDDVASYAAVVCDSIEVYLYLRLIIVAAEPPKYFLRLRL